MDILQSVFPVFLVIAIGAAARRYRFIDEPFVQTANALVYYLLLPALLFYEIGTSNFRQAFNGPLVAGGYVATAAVFLLAFPISRRLGLSPGERGAFIQGSFRANLAYVGLPIVFNAVGGEGLRKAGIFLGFIVPLLKLPLTGFFGKTLSILSAATLPLSLLCLGGSFSFQRARSGFRLAATASVMKIVLLTGIGIAAYRWLGLAGDDLRIGAIMLGCPTAVVTYVMASQLKGDPELAGTIVIVSTAASAFTISGWLFFLRAMGW